MRNLSKILIKPRITEKSALMAETHNAYVFEIEKGTNKGAVADAIKEIYKVTPKKVNIVRLPAKKIFSKGKKGLAKAVIKAYVYLDKGDKIELA